MKITKDWVDDLLMCPSQCYLEFTFNKKPFALYLRWRWNDPWTASLIYGDRENMTDGGVWTDLHELPFFTHNNLENVKKSAIGIVKKRLARGVYKIKRGQWKLKK